MKRGRNQRRRPGANPNRALDSNGPEVRIRGTANQVYDKYVALARDAASAGDRIKAENYLQHAEHYFRVLRAQQPQRPVNGEADGDSEQPSVDDRNNNRRDDQGRRRNQQRDDNAASADGENKEAASDVKAEDKENPESAPAATEEEPEKKPRRRRTRRTPKAAESADSDAGEKTEPEAAAAE